MQISYLLCQKRKLHNQFITFILIVELSTSRMIKLLFNRDVYTLYFIRKFGKGLQEELEYGSMSEGSVLFH